MQRIVLRWIATFVNSHLTSEDPEALRNIVYRRNSRPKTFPRIGRLAPVVVVGESCEDVQVHTRDSLEVS